MLYPAADEREHHRLKAEALAVLLPGYGAAGAEILVVSGVIDPGAGPSTLPKLGLRVCLLEAGEEALRARILARGWDEGDVAEAILEEESLKDASFVDTTIETIGLSVSETVDRLCCLVTAGQSRQSASRPDGRAAWSIDTLMITGPRAVGSSTIGYGLASERWRAGRQTGFVDLQQLGFLAGGGATDAEVDELGLSQLAAMHGHLAAHGAELVVVSGHLRVTDRQALRAALTPSRLTLIRLRADRATIKAHVRTRAAGSEARLAGDDLLGASTESQLAVVAAALAEQAELDAADGDDAVVDVSERTAPDVVEEISVGWLPSAG